MGLHRRPSGKASIRHRKSASTPTQTPLGNPIDPVHEPRAALVRLDWSVLAQEAEAEAEAARAATAKREAEEKARLEEETRTKQAEDMRNKKAEQAAAWNDLLAGTPDVPATEIGRVSEEAQFQIRCAGGAEVQLPVAQLQQAHADALPRRLA